MADSGNSPGNHETLKICLGAIMKNHEMVKFVPEQLESKTICNNAIKKLLFVIILAPDRYKTQ